ncbi:uncharacterized protein si:ch1073-83n3.2 [Silurus meridionalis]|nr:uncharacterized protein si:ch1073-83n3.2 [Silurus meridionalis]XP_046732850.1 uncharacterized protein si:ch1073-83n3.2 [Silurus meridionalis]KAI5092969.1 hypothetical protein C0J45_17360 [Silurus meridionalis]
MTTAGVQRGFLKKYGGFMFKQWKEKYVVLTAEGRLMLCKDADSPPEQVVVLQSNCQSIVEGKEILDLPRLPPGGRRDCCFALILPQNKFILLLSDNPDDCSQWLKIIKKVKESASSSSLLKRQQSISPCITDRGSLPDTPTEKELQSPRTQSRESSFRSRGSICERQDQSPQSLRFHSNNCLRHGNSSDVRAVRAVCLLMGGAAASSALGYLSTCSGSSNVPAQAPEITHSMGFPEVGGEASYHHVCAETVDSPHYNSFDFEGDSDFDAFDCGGFTF